MTVDTSKEVVEIPACSCCGEYPGYEVADVIEALAAQLAEARAEIKACHKENHLKADVIDSILNTCAAQVQTIDELKAELAEKREVE